MEFFSMLAERLDAIPELEIACEDCGKEAKSFISVNKGKNVAACRKCSKAIQERLVKAEYGEDIKVIKKIREIQI